MRSKRLAILALSLLAASASISHAEDDPRLEKILKHWKELPEDLQSCRLSGRRFIYDSVFQVEKRAEFEIAWEQDGRTIIRLMPVDIAKGTQSERLNPQSKAYSLKTELEEIWYWPNRQEIIQVRDNGIERFAQRFKIPASPQSNQGGWWWSWDAVSAIKEAWIEFPIHPALADFTFVLNWDVIKEDEGFYWLSGTAPENSRLSMSYFKQIELIVDKSDLSIFAMKLVDPAGTTDTAYRFDKRRTNPDLAANAEIFNIHEERLKFVEPYAKRKQFEPLRAPKPINDFPSASQAFGMWINARLLFPWLP